MDLRVSGQPALDDLGGRGRGVVQRQIHLTSRIGFQQVLEKGDKVDCQLPFVIGTEPLPADGIQGPEEGATAVGPGGCDAPP